MFCPLFPFLQLDLQGPRVSPKLSRGCGQLLCRWELRGHPEGQDLGGEAGEGATAPRVRAGSPGERRHEAALARRRSALAELCETAGVSHFDCGSE